MTQTQAEMRADKKATRATEEMHRVVTSSLEEIEHPKASHAEKAGAHKVAADTKKHHTAKSHAKKM